MLFNSFEFIFLFLPITLAIFFLLGSKSGKIKQQLLVLWFFSASLIIYGSWKPTNIVLVVSLGITVS
ncbi:MAG: hypothetical protein AAFO95_18575, partial [Cyanobacteria bacterium J06600_6]